jgi:hypothetical protein
MIIDIVYTYVDNSDKDWNLQKKKDIYNNVYTSNSDCECRYNSNLNELMYSIRSLEMFFKDKYNKIYLVTNNGKLPFFLKEHDNIVVLLYSELLGNTSYNSNSIESVLHKIPNLSEYYLYFNDDFMLFKNLNIYDLISNNNELIWYEESNFFMNLLNNTYIYNIYSSVISNIINETVAVARDYTKKLINYNKKKIISHSCRIFKKSLVEEFYNKYKLYIDNLRLEKFRTKTTFCFVDAFCFWAEENGYLLLKNNCKTCILLQSDYEYLNLYNYTILNIIHYYKDYYTFLCIEDNRKKNTFCNNIFEYLENKFNIKSKYE